MQSFDTPWLLFVSIVAVYLLVSMFLLGGWGVFFEPFKEPSDSE